MSIITPALSKAVGWWPRQLSYPTLAEVEAATHCQILEWNRFLPSPDTPERIGVINAIGYRLREEEPEDE